MQLAWILHELREGEGGREGGPWSLAAGPTQAGKFEIGAEEGEPSSCNQYSWRGEKSSTEVNNDALIFKQTPLNWFSALLLSAFCRPILL